MKEKFQRFMIGRYGVDQLSKFMVIVAVILWVLNMFADNRFFYSWGMLILILAYVRMFSRNIQKRYQENQKYLVIKQKVLSRLKKEKSNMEQRKTYHIYVCPTCKQKIRIPRGKGRICITCPKCKTEFTKTS